MTAIDRRSFLRSAAGMTAAGLAPSLAYPTESRGESGHDAQSTLMRFGLVTYMWGFDWDLPVLLRNCETANALGVELRTTHAHGVEPEIGAAQREEVRLRFADSPITLVGLGSNEYFHHTDPQMLRAAIDRAKAFIKLSYDVGGGGVKVKPNDLPSEFSREQTIAQIGNALNELGNYAASYNQEIRLEVHGQCAPLPIIASIMEVADHPNVAVCWNCNPDDLGDKGLDHNFRLVARRLGATTHVRQLDLAEYPNAQLITLLKQVRYDGWLLIEASDQPADRVAALKKQREAFDKLVAS